MSDETQRPALETVFIGGRATARRLQRSRVVVIDGPDKGRAFEFERPRCTIGRSAICDLPLTDRAASGTHCEIEAVESGWVLRDLGSTNGCYVGDVRIREAVLPLGARVRVGTTTLQIEPGKGSVEIPLSTRSRGSAEQSCTTSGPLALFDDRWRALATSSLPVPVSPEMSTVTSRGPTFSSCAKT